MTTLYQNLIIHKLDDTTETVVITHIYAEHGHFLEGGWHIQLGSNAKPEDFHEIVDAGVTHDVPASLPDIEVWEEEDPDAEPDENDATAEDYQDALEAVGVTL